MSRRSVTASRRFALLALASLGLSAVIFCGAASRASARVQGPNRVTAGPPVVAASPSKRPSPAPKTAEPPAPESPYVITASSYAFASSTGVALEDMSTGTTQLVGAATDDANSAVTNIGFDYWYDGVRFTQFGVSSNGLARLGAAPTGTAFSNSLATTTNAPKIVPYWDDLCTGTNGKVHLKTIGAAPNRKLVVEWQNMQITRGAACSGTGNGTFQLWLFETSGVIEFVYGAIQASAAADGGYSVGLQSGAATNFASVTTTGNSVSYVTANNTQTNAIASGTAYTFTPNVPSAPSGLTFTGTNAAQTTLNWTDNSSNEAGFVVYRSDDGGVNYSFLTQTAANATSFTDTTLSPVTTYFYRVLAVTEGAVSSAVQNSVTTTAAGNVSSTAAGGNWSDTATWVGGVVPTTGDNVTIDDGATVMIDTAAFAYTLTVGTGGTPATLKWEPTTARTLTVGSNVQIAGNSIFQSAATGTQTGHLLTVGGNLINNGVLDFSTNGNTAGAAITFTGAASSTFGGTGGATDVRAVTVNKGTSSASILELTSSNFTVRGVNTDVAGFLTLTNGTLKISGTFTMTNRIFIAPAYSIPATAGIWLNNPNFTVPGQAGGIITANNGLFRLTQGTYGIGVTGADGLGGGSGAQFIVEGGTINATRIDPQGAVTWTQTAGTVNVGVVANTRTNFGTFEVFNAASTFNMSGGTINLVNASVAATPVDYRVLGVANITGGTLNVGTAATATNFNFRIRGGSAPALVVDNTTNTKTATFTEAATIFGNVTIKPGTTFAVDGFPVRVRGNVVNDGDLTVTGTSVNSRFSFNDTAGTPQTYSGTGTAGTVATPLGGVDFNSVGGVTFNPSITNVVTNRINHFVGNVTNTNKVTLGSGGASTAAVQIGSAGTPTNPGSFDVAPTFNLGSGGQNLLYVMTTTGRTTGIEINPTRVVNFMLYDDTDLSHTLTIAGGDLTLSGGAGALQLNNGRVVTNANALILDSGAGTVARTNGYVDGNLRIAFSGPASKTFTVGTANGYSPVTANVTAGTFSPTSELQVKATQGPHPNLNPALSLQRYWTLTETGDLTADLTFNYLDPPDVNGNESSYQLFRISGGIATNQGGVINTGANTASITGVSSFSDWGLGQPNSPTRVLVRSFSAKRSRSTVALRWRSGTEAGVAGYVLYRGSVRLNRRIVAAHGGVHGVSYRFVDRKAPRAAARYRLRVVLLSGTRIWAGSARVGQRG